MMREMSERRRAKAMRTAYFFSCAWLALASLLLALLTGDLLDWLWMLSIISLALPVTGLWAHYAGFLVRGERAGSSEVRGMVSSIAIPLPLFLVAAITGSTVLLFLLAIVMLGAAGFALRVLTAAPRRIDVASGE